jgi:hypothetical protein
MKFNNTLKPLEGILDITWDEADQAYRVKYVANSISGNYQNHVASFKRLQLNVTDRDNKTKQLTLAGNTETTT